MRAGAPVVRATVNVLTDDCLADLVALAEWAVRAHDDRGSYLPPRMAATVEAARRVVDSTSPTVADDEQPTLGPAEPDALFAQVAEVARRATLSREYVRRLCRTGRLRARLDRGRYEIDRASAEHFLATRLRSVA